MISAGASVAQPHRARERELVWIGINTSAGLVALAVLAYARIVQAYGAG